MFLRLRPAALVACIAASTPTVAQRSASYSAPRTEYGHPDFQGVWATEFLTPLERPDGVAALVATPEQAQTLWRPFAPAFLPSVIRMSRFTTCSSWRE
jgi:hypothetical protein